MSFIMRVKERGIKRDLLTMSTVKAATLVITNMELSLNDSERNKPKHLAERVTHCHLVLQKSHVYWLG
jgi:hypothetical protein